MKTFIIIFFLLPVFILQAQEKQRIPACKKQINYLGKSTSLHNKEAISPVEFQQEKPEIDNLNINQKLQSNNKDGAVQRHLPKDDPIPILQNFEGVGSIGMPNPDTEGDVGLNHYFQMVKRSFAVYDKTGNVLYGPADNQTLWSDFPGPWDNMGWTDPIVLYDHLADRWLISCMVYELDVEYYEMIAVSTSPDPLGEYYCYSMWFDVMPDYPKFGLWPDGYYLSVNEWAIAGSATFVGASVIVFNREEMIAGEENPGIYYYHFDAPNHSTTQDIGSFLPSHLEGPIPPEGTPNYFICVRDDAWGYPEDRIWIWECVVDWADTTNSYFSELAILETEPFNSHTDDHQYIHQPNSSFKLHSLAFFLMYRLQYRNYGDFQSLVCNHTVEVDGDEHGAVRWYEMRDEGEGWYIRQQSSFAPDEDSRWMASLALDKDANLAVGYSVSGDATFPSIRVSGQRYDDPLSLLNFPESEIITGSASQINNNRWGDYSTMSVDPVDDLTFWYTQEYIETSGPLNWQTRIASFQLHKNLDVSADSLVFVTASECFEGKPLYLKNNSQFDIQVIDVEAEGLIFNEIFWYALDSGYVFPYLLPPGDSLFFTVWIPIYSGDNLLSYQYDTLSIFTDYKDYNVIIGFNDSILVHQKEYYNLSESFIVFPNPFTQKTTIQFENNGTETVSLQVFDARLNLVKTLISDKPLAAGSKQIIWQRDNNNTKVKAGLYYIQLSIGERKMLKKVIVK